MLNLHIRIICFKTRDYFMKGLDSYCRYLETLTLYVGENARSVILLFRSQRPLPHGHPGPQKQTNRIC
jgi:hypothetical protein